MSDNAVGVQVVGAQCQPVAGAGPVELQGAAGRCRRAVEVAGLDTGMVVEIFDVTQIRGGGRDRRMQPRRTVRRDVELVRCGQRRGR